MDPDANLEEQLRIAYTILYGKAALDPDAAIRLAELVAAMDNWIILHGSLPKKWKRAQNSD